MRATSLALLCASAAALPARFPAAVIAARAEAAMLGSIVADAAAMPLHWQYSTQKIADLVKGGPPEFFSPPQNLWYNGKLGGNTPYGQQALAYLSVGGSAAGFASPAAVEAAYWALYNPAVCPGDAGGWYLDSSTREFIANEQAGKHFPDCGGNDNQADAAAHAVIVAALLAGNTSAMLDALEPVIRVTQDTQDAAAFGAAAARLFEKVLVYNYSSGAAAVDDTVADLRDAARLHPFPQDAALADAMAKAAAAARSGEASLPFIVSTGQSCDYPFTLPNVAFLTAALGGAAADCVSGARQNVRAARAALRACIIGARCASPAFPPLSFPRRSSPAATAAAEGASLAPFRARGWATRASSPPTGRQKRRPLRRCSRSSPPSSRGARRRRAPSFKTHADFSKYHY